MRNDHYHECPNCHFHFQEILRICEKCGFDMKEHDEEKKKPIEEEHPYYKAIIHEHDGKRVYDDNGNKIEYPSKIKSIFKKSKIKPMVVSD